jgi:hypothetical protein
MWILMRLGLCGRDQREVLRRSGADIVRTVGLTETEPVAGMAPAAGARNRQGVSLPRLEVVADK